MYIPLRPAIDQTNTKPRTSQSYAYATTSQRSPGHQRLVLFKDGL